MDFFKKIQNRPEKERNRIFWAAVVISVAIVGFFWVKSFGHSFERLKTEVGGIDKAPKSFIEKTKDELPISQFEEALNRFKDLLKSEKAEEFLKEKEQNK